MPDINNYINEKEQKFKLAEYQEDLKKHMQAQLPDENIDRYALAVSVLELEHLANKHKWLGGLAFWVAMVGYADTVNEFAEKLEKKGEKQ